ncbi:MAG: hypothetical protein RBU37_06525 [Myxococcota bacterium]|jgi:DNA-binding beta-propeller fold protein YncE|nr:hypothetical protein [Myxococcota bacterium]
MMRFFRRTKVLLLTLAGLALLGCGDGEWGEPEPAPDGWQDWGADSTQDQGELPEPEKELRIQPPEAAKDFVFVASTELDSVARIDARSMEIRSIAVGDRPTVVRCRKSTNTAVVLNLGSSDLSIIHSTPGGGDVLARLPVASGLNQVRLSPDGRYALVYFDPEAEGADFSTSPLIELQLVQLARVEQGSETIVDLVISYLPEEILFEAEGDDVFVLTQDFLHRFSPDTVIDAPSSYDPRARIKLIEDPLSIGKQLEVVISSGGHFALVREPDQARLGIVDLLTQEHRILELDGIPTELDLLPDGLGALLVIPSTQQLVLLSLPEAFDEPESVRVIQAPESIPVAQALVSPSGDKAVLFSTAASSSTIGELDLSSAELTAYRLGSGKVISGGVRGPQGKWIYIAHDGEPSNPDPVRQSPGFSLLSFDSAENGGRPFDKLFLSPIAPSPVMFTEDEQHFFALINQPTSERFEVIGIELPSLRATTFRVGSPPVQVGGLPDARRVYVAQEHPVGRLAFIEVDDLSIQTVTGFELNSKIR